MVHESHTYQMTKPNTCPVRISAMLSATVPRLSLKKNLFSPSELLTTAECDLPTDPLQSQFRLNISHNTDYITIPAVATSFLTIPSPIKLWDVTTLHHHRRRRRRRHHHHHHHHHIIIIIIIIIIIMLSSLVTGLFFLVLLFN